MFHLTPLQTLSVLSTLLVARLLIATRPPAERSAAALRSVREWLDTFLVSGSVVFVLATFIVRPFYIPSGSMEPTLQINDVLAVDEIGAHLRDPRRGEIVVFHPPANPSQDWIKRIIAVPGDTLDIHNGVVFVNGVALRETYIADPPEYDLSVRNCTLVVNGMPLDASTATIPPPTAWQACDRIPAGYYVVMGDNRNDSDDSHIWGLLPRSNLVGYAVLRMWPPPRIAHL